LNVERLTSNASNARMTGDILMISGRVPRTIAIFIAVEKDQCINRSGDKVFGLKRLAFLLDNAYTDLFVILRASFAV